MQADSLESSWLYQSQENLNANYAKRRTLAPHASAVLHEKKLFKFAKFIIRYIFFQQLLLAVYTERSNRSRIISARSATRAERKFVEALLKLYIGQSMRQDLAKLSADRVLEKTAQVLTRHIHSEKEVSAILKEIRVETVP
jgi:uncharacterized DUF497 family protein